MSSNLQNAPVLTSGAAASVSPPLYTQFLVFVLFSMSWSNNSFNKDFAVLNKMTIVVNVHKHKCLNCLAKYGVRGRK